MKTLSAVNVDWTQAPAWAECWIAVGGQARWVCGPTEIDVTTLTDWAAGQSRFEPGLEFAPAPAPLFDWAPGTHQYMATRPA